MSLGKELVRDTIDLCRVPAPTGQEERRGRLLIQMLAHAGLDAQFDTTGNVVAELPGRPDLPVVAVAAHLDTVFPGLDPIEVGEEDGWLTGPGIGDNCAGIAALPALARELPREGLGRILLVGTVGEEGNGNLAGIRGFVDDRGGELDAVLAVEGAMADRIVTGAVGAERLRIAVSGPGGHSWGDAGAPSAIEGIAHLVADLYALPRPETPPNSLSVGMIRGGQSVNSIAADARIDLDLRSADAALLADLRARAVRAAGERFPAAGALRAEVSSLGSRPAGLIDAAHALVGHARAARAHLGLDPAREVAASTDANLPLSRGIPATCLGIGTGVDAHKPTERLRIEGLDRGFLALLETVRRAAGDPGLRRG